MIIKRTILAIAVAFSIPALFFGCKTTEPEQKQDNQQSVFESVDRTNGLRTPPKIQSSPTEQKESQPRTIAEIHISPAADHPQADHVIHSRTIVERKRLRPRTMAEARIRHVEDTPFSADRLRVDDVTRKYVDTLRERVINRWREAVKTISPSPVKGGVTLRFHLLPDGRVTTLNIVRTTGDSAFALVCKKAILDCAPFEKWPSEMLKASSADYKEITFEFNYTTD
jgi:hypothetical protein